MEYPFGHHRHNHHNRREESDDNPDRPIYPPPPPSVVHVSHVSHYPPPREDSDFDSFGRRDDHRPPPPAVVHVSHYPPPREDSDSDSFGRRDDLYDGPERPTHHHPPPPAVVHVSHDRPPREDYDSFRGDHGGGVGSLVYHHTHTHDGGPSTESNLSGKATVKVYSKADPDFVMAVRHGKVILARADPADDAQHWIKDEKYSTKVKDQDGFPCFGLVNKASGQSLKHSLGPTHPVQLIPYNANALDESVLWTEGRDLGDGFRPIRMVNNVRLHLDAFHGDKKSGGIHDGTTIVLWDWNKGDNQRWKIVPYYCN